MQILDETEDFLLRGHDAICQRYAEIEDAVDEHPDVIEYITNIDKHE